MFIRVPWVESEFHLSLRSVVLLHSSEEKEKKCASYFLERQRSGGELPGKDGMESDVEGSKGDFEVPRSGLSRSRPMRV
mgnify:CR=1 FL=1